MLRGTSQLSFYEEDQQAFLDVVSAMEHLAAHASLEALTLVVHMPTTTYAVHSEQEKLY